MIAIGNLDPISCFYLTKPCSFLKGEKVYSLTKKQYQSIFGYFFADHKMRSLTKQESKLLAQSISKDVSIFLVTVVKLSH